MCTAIAPKSIAAPQPCEAYSASHPEIPPGIYSNCPLVLGNFQNDRWQVTLNNGGEGIYTYEGSDLRQDSSIFLESREVRGTTDRPVCTFRNGNAAYTVTFHANDYNPIRFEVFQRQRCILNELLTRF